MKSSIRRVVLAASLVTAIAGGAVTFGATAAMAGGVRWQNAATGRCLDSNGDGNVYAFPCNGGAYQYWTAEGPKFIDNATGRCLDTNGDGNVYTLPCNGGNFQNWYRVAGSQTIRNHATGRCLDSNGDGNVYALPCNGGNFQNWIAF